MAKYRPMPPEVIALLRSKPGGSRWGRDRDIVCATCGIGYDEFRSGVTFMQVRRDIIAIGYCTKMGHVKYGRRNGVLGYMFECKQMAWKAHVAECAAWSEARDRWMT